MEAILSNLPPASASSVRKPQASTITGIVALPRRLPAGFRPSSLCGLVGMNGAGKSTLSSVDGFCATPPKAHTINAGRCGRRAAAKAVA